MKKHLRYVSGPLICAVISGGAGAQIQVAEPDFIRKYETDGVPKQSRTVEFDPSKNFPLPSGGKGGDVAFTVNAQPPSDAEKKAFETALRTVTTSQQLTVKLGDNSRLLSGGELPKAKADENGTRTYKFTFYNYSKDQAIEAYVVGDTVTQVRERELGFQPTVSNQELVDAAKIFNDQSPLNLSVEALRALAQSGPDGRRQIHVFSADPASPKSIVIDLAAKKVVEVNR